jgi:hypothetical protein
MVAAVRAGRSQRSVAAAFGVGLGTVQLRLAQAGDDRLDRVDWSDRPSIRHRLERTSAELEDLILVIRRDLRERSVLGEYGAAAIRRELAIRDDLAAPMPALRTIGRILERRGALDAKARVRRPAPPPGWYLPEVRTRQVELDSFDVIEGLRLQGGLELGVLTGISLHGGLAGTWVDAGMSAHKAVAAFLGHWRSVGLPAYAQFDNDPRFIGSHANPDSIGPVIRLCLALGVVPVFVPPRETGFQAAIESFNGRWQAKLWARVWSDTLSDLQRASDRYIVATRARSAARIEAAPPRDSFPTDQPPDLDRPPRGRLVFIRRTTETGTISILGRRYEVDRQWPYRLVRSELDLDGRVLRFFALRRRDPTDQPCLGEVPYTSPARWYG